MSKEHRYAVTIRWTGNLGKGTETYRAYARDHEILSENKPTIPASSDPAFRGDPSRYNPEDLLVASLSGCHMLWYLHLCADARIIVTDYVDDAIGIMEETAEGGGWFTRVVLRPRVTIAREDDLVAARRFHAEAHRLCFIANSVNFPVDHEATIIAADAAPADRGRAADDRGPDALPNPA